MSKKYAIAHTYKVNPSLWLVKWLVFIHLLSVVATFLNALAIAYKLSIVIVILLSLAIQIKKMNKFFVIRYSLISGWEIAYLEGDFDQAEICGSTVITQYLIVLHYKIQNQQKRTMIICRDALINDDFRMLVVQLKITGLVTSNS